MEANPRHVELPRSISEIWRKVDDLRSGGWSRRKRDLRQALTDGSFSSICQEVDMNVNQIADQIKKVISFALYYELRDPAFRDMTITRVKVSRDLQFADIRFTSIDTVNDIDVIEDKLNRAGGAFRSILGKKLKLRRTPKLRFHYDMDILAEQKIQAVLNRIHEEESSE
ncbi:MAG: ribosome-binding factor A [Acidobacteria bacterium]|nr:MAG: ribosome-binding factor A [Acidobacteriota bacterium]PIE91425.1 MAG: ribosome-binding factor A [Acidobacteriota bacterium]